MNNILNNLIQLYWENPLWQIIWVLAFIISMIAFLHKEDKKFYFVIVTANLLWTIHFYMVWLYIASFISIINLSRNLSALLVKKNLYLLLAFIILYIWTWYYFYTNTLSLLPVVWWIFATLWVLYFSWITGRWVLLLASFSWVIYAYLWWSIWWMLSEGMIIIVSTITIIRLIIDKKKIWQKKYLLSEAE